ncbi:hypothetical protein Y032_0026g1408 [Ancylostoma ceylanicum]|uniref:Uncharacterized protein n=1 Tax=Ancylostoma ceylanicum TaxID=53326 RepID=A0A016UVN3_9BILA|nr:hypothetical protein Y032_0026g1408 [Ancylostoma ceylanicum]
MRRALLSCRQHIRSARFCSGITKATPSQITRENAKFDEITHTGQAWDQADYRLQRFDISKKQACVGKTCGRRGVGSRPTNIGQPQASSFQRYFEQ